MKLGAFSMSLNVKDLEVSRGFYKKLGFDDFGGDASHNYLIMKNGDTIIGLFQGMIPANTLTFNPGWDQNAQNVDAFDDVREIQKALTDQGIELASDPIEAAEGPAHIMVIDPDGNAVLIDQHR